MHAFCPTQPVGVHRAALVPVDVQRRCPRLCARRVDTRRRASMSLTNDLIVKALEVGVATVLGNTFATQAQAQTRRGDKGGLFGLGATKKKRRDATTSIDADQVQSVVAEALRVAERVAEVLETGGPEGKKWVKLAICIAIDLIGSGSLAVPFLGDALDIVTAPMSAVMLQALFGSSLVTIGGFMEEILPGTDGIPTATLAWLAENNGFLVGDEVREKR